MYESITPSGNPVNQRLHSMFQRDLIDRQTQGMEAWKTYDDWYNEVVKPVVAAPQTLRGTRSPLR